MTLMFRLQVMYLLNTNVHVKKNRLSKMMLHSFNAITGCTIICAGIFAARIPFVHMTANSCMSSSQGFLLVMLNWHFGFNLFSC